MLRNGTPLRSYNDLAGRNGGGLCRDATMPRDNLAGSSSRCPAARDALLSRCTLTTRRSHRTIDPHALKIPARGAEYSLTENVASPFQAEPRQFRVEGAHTAGNAGSFFVGSVSQSIIRVWRKGQQNQHSLASLIVEQSTNQMGMDRFQKVLAGIVSEFSSFELSTLKRPSSTQTLWQEIKTVQEVRNGVVHRGETVGEEVAKQSIEIANMLLNVVFPDVLSKLDLHTHPPIRICSKAHQKPPSSTPQS